MSTPQDRLTARLQALRSGSSTLPLSPLEQRLARLRQPVEEEQEPFRSPADFDLTTAPAPLTADASRVAPGPSLDEWEDRGNAAEEVMRTASPLSFEGMAAYRDKELSKRAIRAANASNEHLTIMGMRSNYKPIPWEQEDEPAPVQAPVEGLPAVPAKPFATPERFAASLPAAEPMAADATAVNQPRSTSEALAIDAEREELRSRMAVAPDAALGSVPPPAASVEQTPLADVGGAGALPGFERASPGFQPGLVEQGFRSATEGMVPQALGNVLQNVADILQTSQQGQPYSELIRSAAAIVERFGDDRSEKWAVHMAPLRDILARGSVKELIDWARYTTGQGIGTSLPIIAGAVAGGPAGALGTSYAMNSGSMRESLEEEAPDLSEGATTALSAGLGAPLAALDMVVPGRVAEKVLSRVTTEAVTEAAASAASQAAEQTAAAIARRFVAEAFRAGRDEGITEGLQTFIERGAVSAANDEPVFTRENVVTSIEGAAAGLLPGALMGGAGQLVSERPSAGDVEGERADTQPISELPTAPPVDPARPELPISEYTNNRITEPQPEQAARVGEYPVAEIDVEPDRFQFKLSVDESGVGQELKSVRRFDPNLAGVIQVWRDPEDGRAKVVNGHHRLELAKRTGEPAVLVRFVDAADAAEARTIGAMTNIAEGRGTAVDAAKLFRDSGITPAELEERGISLRAPLARDGLALSKLPQRMFQDVIAQRLPVARAAVIGGSGLDEAEQQSLYALLQRKERRGRALTNEGISELIRFVRGAGTEQVTQENLFGEETLTQSLALEKAELSAWVKDRLAKDRRLFGYLTKGERAGKIEEAGAGSIDVEKAGAIATDAAQAEEVYTRLSAMSGPVSSALNDAARELARGGNVNEIREDLYNRVRGSVSEALSGGEGAGAVRGVGNVEGAAEALPESDTDGGSDPDQATLLDPVAQDDLFTGPARVDTQPSLDLPDTPATLERTERVARSTVDRLRPLVERGAATPAQTEQYREALALIRRDKAQSAEEVRLRAQPQSSKLSKTPTGQRSEDGQEVLLDPDPRARAEREEELPGEGGDEPDEETSAPPPRELGEARPRRELSSPRDAVSGRSAGAPIGSRMYGNLEVPAAPKKGEGVAVPHVIGALARVTEAAGRTVPIRIGRLGTRHARGIYKVGPEVIRILEAGNIPTSAHEVGHALEKAVYGWPKGGPWRKPRISAVLQKELHALGYALYGKTKPAGGYKREGFAEFMRLWVTTDGDAAAAAPNFARWFDDEFSREYPDVRKALDEAKELATRWRTQGARERARMSMVDTGSPREQLKIAGGKVRNFVSMENLVEMAQPHYEAAREAESRLGRELRPEEDPFFTISALRTTHAARAKYMVEDGMIDLAGNPVGPALAEIRALVENRRQDFTIYLWARRAMKLHTDPKGARNPGLTMQDAAQIIRELETPEFQLAAPKVYEWNDGVLNYAAQASPTFAEVVKKVRERDPGDYVPLQRLFDDLDAAWLSAQKSGGNASRSSPVKRLKGSGRRIKDLFPAMIAKAEQTIRQAHERAVLEALLRFAKVEGMGHWIEEVPVDQVPAASASISELLEKINDRLFAEAGVLAKVEGEEEGAIDSDLLGQTITFFADAQRPNGKDPVFPVWDRGRLRWFQLDEGLYDALASLDVYRMPYVADLLLGKPARVFRAGTTGLRASFGLIWNPLRDVQTMWVNTRTSANGARLFAEWARSIGEMAMARTTGKRTEWVDTFIRLGGEMAQPLGQDIPHTSRAARRLFQGRRVRALDPRNWFDFYRDLVQFPEAAPRIAELRLVAEEIGWKPGQPMTMSQSMQLLLAAKQVTTDFTAAGEFARVVNQIAPFHNAAIQGPRASIRAARRNPIKFATRGLQLTAVTMLLWWAHKDEEWYHELSYRDKFLHWHFPFKNPFTGADELARLPRSFDIGAVFSALPEMFVDAWYAENPKQVKAWFKVLFETATPNVMPVLLAEAKDQWKNLDDFWDTPIVPRREEQKPAEEQFDEYTSRVAILLGDLFNKSPRRIDHGIRGIFGPVASDLLELLGLGPAGVDREKELADTPLVGRLFQRGGQLGTHPRSIEEMYVALEEAQKRQHSDRKPETEKERQLRLQLEDAAKAIGALMYVRRSTEDTRKRVALMSEVKKIASEATARTEDGKVQRSYFADARKRAEDREDLVKTRQASEARAEKSRERRRLLGREDATAKDRPGRAEK